MEAVETPKMQGNLDTNFLKLIAVATMAIDHAGAIFFPDIGVIRIIGRLAFPLFAYCLVIGCLYTRDIGKYVLRLGLFALISQPFYVLAHHPFDLMQNFWNNFFVLNIFFTLLVGVITIWGLKEKNWLLFALGILTACFVNIDYGINGICLMVIFYLCRKKRWLSALLAAVWLIPSLFFGMPDTTLFGLRFNRQGLSALALPLIFVRTSFHPKINKWFFYLFYPGHFLVFYLIQLFIQ